MDAVSYAHSAKQAKRIKKFIENPDSNSGIVTVPKVIEAGESVTVPAGRVAVLPNVQVDGTLNIEGEVFIPTGATFSKVVETEGNQDIDGIKTFIESPIVPTPTAGDNSTKAATTAFVKAKSEADSIGVGQTWQDVTSSRSAGVTYTNTTGKPIMVKITTTQTGNPGITVNIDGVVITYHLSHWTNGHNFDSFIVPNGSTYTVTTVGLSNWSELR